MRKIKKRLVAKWEIMTTAEIVETEYKNKPIDDEFFDLVYKGNFVRTYRDGRTDSKQVWKIQILTKAQDEEGNIHEHLLEWEFDKQMTIREVLEGAKHIKMNNEFKTRWTGVTKQWLSCVDEDLKGMVCLEAWCTAECLANVIPERAKNKFNRLMLNVA